nr:hypothetical protein CFP56_39324 [Quercus suber]
MAKRSNNRITHHNFDNSMAAATEGYKEKRTRDDYDGAGSSNYEPHPKRIERLTESMAQGNSNCEESSEHKECAEELECLIRVSRPGWHSLGTSFKWEDLPYKDCGFTVRFCLNLLEIQTAHAFLEQQGRKKSQDKIKGGVPVGAIKERSPSPWKPSEQPVEAFRVEHCQTCEALTAYLNLESSLILLPFMEREEAVTMISVQHSVLFFRLSTNTMLNSPVDLITFRLTLNTQPRNLLAPLPTEWMTGHAHMTNHNEAVTKLTLGGG